MLIRIPGAMTFKIVIKVYAGNYLRNIIALRKNDPQVLLLQLCIAFQGVGGTGHCVRPAFPVIDVAMLQDILYFRLGNMPAIHPAPGMVRIDEVAYLPVKPIIPGATMCCFPVGIPLDNRICIPAVAGVQ
jgi:hypothetical protein